MLLGNWQSQQVQRRRGDKLGGENQGSDSNNW